MFMGGSMTYKISGGCACGAVRYEIAADPQFRCQCQRRGCQRTTGAGHSDILGFSENGIAMVGTLSFHEAAGDSGKSVGRGFCPKCGSPLLWNSRRFPGLHLLRPAAWMTQACSSRQAVLYTSHAWDHLDLELPKFEKLGPRD
jgi:hypothetical protein